MRLKVFFFFISISGLVLQSFAQINATQLKCEGTRLLNEQKKVIKDFTFASDCSRAAQNQRENFACLVDATKTLLVNTAGKELYTFTFESACNKALTTAKNNSVCVSQDAQIARIHYRLGKTTEFNFEVDCLRSLESTENIFFCENKEKTKNILKNKATKKEIFEFKSQPDCEAALIQAEDGYLCGNDLEKFILIDANHGKIHDSFSFEAACKSAREKLIN